MQKWILACMLLALNITTATAQSYDEKVRKYINEFKQLAIEEQLRSGIPASITLAQGIHETSAGASELATNANNHFGIKCKKSWTGETYAYTDDAPDECFRKYTSAFMSYKDHSDYLSKTPRYASLFTLSKTDYASWAKGLRQAGYATNPKYAQILIRLIEDYRLQEYTYAAMDNSMGNNIAVRGEVVPEHDAIPVVAAVVTAPPVMSASIPVEEVPMPAANKRKSKIVVSEVSDNSPADASITYPPYGEQVKVNDLKAIYAKKGDMPLEYALKTNIRYEKLLEINDISDKPLPADMYLYLEKKHSKGLRPRHVVKEGETIANVSQYEGVLARSIRSMNQLGANDEPVSGTILYLQEETTRKPRLIARTEPAGIPTVVVPETTPLPPATPVVAAEVVPANENTLASADVPEPTSVVENGIVSTTKASAEPTAAMPTVATVAVPDVQEVVTTPGDAASINKEIGPSTPAVETPVVAAETSAPNPPVNIANEKPVEEIIKEENKTAQHTPPPPAAEEPKDELDALKARFDKVVYSRKPAAPVDTVTASKAEVKKEETVVAAPTPEIPIKKEPVAAPATAISTGARFYVVKKGDTAFSIAKKSNISMRQLMDWNKLDFEAIKVGQRLRIQEP